MGLEPTASASAGLRSIQLSYKRLFSETNLRAPIIELWQLMNRYVDICSIVGQGIDGVNAEFP